MRYPASVQRHFAQPQNVGPFPCGGLPVCRGEAGSTALGTWIVIEAVVAEGRVRRAAFQAFGCPYVIAACSRATEVLSGVAPAALADFDVLGLARELDVPAERLGRLLVLQDALRNCFADWDTRRPDAAP